jgi:V/A-type H+-transporting ATPase subunit E
MEELRSTEILDKEILEDARKKAQRVLAKSEKDAQKVLDGVSDRVETALAEKTSVYDKKYNRFREDLESALPLEQKRFLVSFEDTAVTNAISLYIESLTNEKQLFIIEKLISRYKCVLKDKKVHIVVSGFEVAEMKKLSNKVLGAASVLSCKKMAVADEKFLSAEYGNSKGAVLETEDHSIVCRAVIGELLSEISDTYSFELVSTLFGGRLPE